MKAIAISNSIKRKNGMPLANWPRCQLCGTGVDSVNTEEATRRSCVMRAKHHGAEDVVKVMFDWDWEKTDLGVPCNWIVFFPVEDYGNMVIRSK